MKFAFADVVAETSSHGDMENVDGRLTVVVAFDAGFQLHDKACWRWIERWLLLDPSRIHLTLLHVARAKHVEAHLELTSYRYLNLEDCSRYLPYDVWKNLKKRKYPSNEVLVLTTTSSVSTAILQYMQYDAPAHSLLVLGGRHERSTSVIPRFLMGSVSTDVVTKISSHPVLLIRTRLFEDVTVLRTDTIGAAYLGVDRKPSEDEIVRGRGRFVCIAVDADHVKSLVHYCRREILRKTDVVQIIHCAADEHPSTIARVSKEVEDVRVEMETFLDDKTQLDSVLLDFSGDIRDKIVDHCREMQPQLDMLVIGNRVTRRLTRAIIGSTAQYILQHAHVPVYMVPDHLLECMEAA